MADLDLNGAVFAHSAVVMALIDKLAEKGILNAQDYADIKANAKRKAAAQPNTVTAIDAMYT